MKYRLDDSLGYKLFHASRLMCNKLNQNFKSKDYPVTYEQWQILSRLYQKDGQTQNSLSRQNERDQASVSRLVDNLIKRGLVKRNLHPDDGRVNIICLTNESKKIRENLEQLATNTINEAGKGIDTKDLETCLRVLDQIRENLK
ncbi:DNA-binding MarR family transcriptional regulator [Bacillus pakistanensis]|uniref:DNA-binding MarR family transcriptional regulator n=1 Tax=Rossellomorea pakistanensis TaxID=992288 RepID=A0ABS2N7H5_9BACI|nr:MarR family winged helix-turn-helix transcriptional regulator [Bacillus pakistanensis]MBM7583810.1 DNA-binding MarR family transcriptional regulator [Bacillus pakistanensis]